MMSSDEWNRTKAHLDKVIVEAGNPAARGAGAPVFIRLRWSASYPSTCL